MTKPAKSTLSRHFTHLVGRSVTFTEALPNAAWSTRQVFGTYDLFPGGHPETRQSLLVKADLELFGSLAGCLVGFPESEVTMHLKAQALDEVMIDAINEILNVASAVVSPEDRVVLIEMVTDRTKLRLEAGQLMDAPSQRADFTVTIQGYRGGRFTVLA